MEESHDIEGTADLCASRRLRELRSGLAQEKFGPRIGMKGVTLAFLEMDGKALAVPPSTFIFHDDKDAYPPSIEGREECDGKKGENAGLDM